MSITEQIKHKLYQASIGMIHGKIKNHPDLIEILKQQNKFFSGDETQPVQKFIKEFRDFIIEVGYEPE